MAVVQCGQCQGRGRRGDGSQCPGCGGSGWVLVKENQIKSKVMKKIYSDIPSGKTLAAKKARKRFLRIYQRNLVDPMKKIALDILIWGPSPSSGTPVARKRSEIRKALLALGHNAMFSEEIPEVDVEYLPSEKSKELAQALSAHLIIALIEDSPGALGEVHDFCDHPVLAPKIYVSVPKKYKAGFSAKGAIKDLDEGYGGVYWYDKSELESCDVLTKAVKRVEARRYVYSRYTGLL